MKKNLIALVAAATLALSITACTPVLESSAPEPDVAPISEPSYAPTPEVVDTPEPEVDDMILGFGEAMTWIDNVALSVSAPSEFQPTEYAAGADQAYNVIFRVVITNNSGAVLNPSVYARVSSGGQEASSIYDFGSPHGDLGGSPSTAILPGQTVEWLEAYSIADPNNITFQVAPSYDYEDAIFTNIQ